MGSKSNRVWRSLELHGLLNFDAQVFFFGVIPWFSDTVEVNDALISLPEISK